MEKLKSCLKEKETNLSECILRFILIYPDGVNMKEIEDEFGETRMLLGYILNKLCEAGKIMKLTNQYYRKSVE